MKYYYIFPKLGEYLGTLMSRMGITKGSICEGEHVGGDIFTRLKKGRIYASVIISIL